jgi:hypothetical protein
MKARKSWKEKLADDKGLPKVITVDAANRMAKKWGTGTCIVPAPTEVDEIMRTIPKGKLITINEIRVLLAKKHKADYACPITTGIFSWIAANAAEEEAAAGKKRITPYWRTLKTGGELNPKYPGGIGRLRELLESEGHKVIAKGKRTFVAEFEKSLVKPSGI